MSEHTKDRLAAALREVGLDDMAAKAAEGYYDDFLSPLGAPITQLVIDLSNTAQEHEGMRANGILDLARRAVNGDFDATTEDAEAWAASPDGQETLGKVVKGLE